MNVNLVSRPFDSPFDIYHQQLDRGRFYECSNGTIVFVSRGKLDHDNPLNIENGLGGYGQLGETFRPITPKDLTFEF